MVEVSQKTKYVKLDDGVSFLLVRTNPKLTTNTKLMYNGKKMYMESYASSELLNRSSYKNVSIRQNSTYNKDIANFLTGSGYQAYRVYQNFSDIAISDSYDNQFENFYWCGAESIDSSFYDESIGFIAPLYLREKLPNYFLIFRLDSPSNYNLNVDANGKPLDSSFDFKTDILDKAVLIKTFDLREGSVLGNYIHNYVEQEAFEFDKSMYVNFSNGEVTYYGINRINGVLEKKVENFENELLKSDNPILKNDAWFTEGFERNNLIFPYIINIEYLFDDDIFKENDKSYEFSRYIGLYCNNIEFGEFNDFNELVESGYTQDNAIYYFEDKNNNLHRYTNDNSGFKIDNKDVDSFDVNLISGFEKDRITGYAEPLDINEGYINRAHYGFEILKPFEPGDWIAIKYGDVVECYFADDKNISDGKKYDMLIGEYDDCRFSVIENSTVNDIAESLAKSVNQNKNSKFEAKYLDNFVVFYAKREGKEYNDAKMFIEASLFYNRKISLPVSNNVTYIKKDSDSIVLEKSLFGDYYIDQFGGACDVDIDLKTDTYKNIFKIYYDECVFFGLDRYLKTNNGNGRRIVSNMIYVNGEGKIDPKYRIIIVDDAPNDEMWNSGYDISVSSTCQVEILDLFKPNYGVFSWFPVKDFDFDINYSSYGQYDAFVDECKLLSEKIIYKNWYNIEDFDNGDSDDAIILINVSDEIKSFPKSPLYDDYGNSLETEYDYYLEQFHPNLCLMSKTTPYISKWGYRDEQKDSCENPYRLNVSKIFGVSNLSANTYLKNCDENEYTHSMPYFMTFNSPNYYKDYQYIESDKIYAIGNKSNERKIVSVEQNDKGYNFDTFSDCINYWIDIFKKTDVDMFSHFFSGKKYGKKFDRKYSRLLGGDKFNNASTLFRGVKFEMIREYNGIEKRSSEYNGYKFSFIYIPVMIDTIAFYDTVYFVKNDTFKFVVGIIFVNTMLGVYDHNIFKGDVDYFNKGFLYIACKNIIKAENRSYKYVLNLNFDNDDLLGSGSYECNIESDILDEFYKNKIDVNNDKFYIWYENPESVIISKKYPIMSKDDIIGKLDIKFSELDGSVDVSIIKFENNYNDYTIVDVDSEEDVIFKWDQYFEEYDTTIYGYDMFKYCGEMVCSIKPSNITYNNIVLSDVCDLNWEYVDETNKKGFRFDLSNIYFKSQSIRNMLINMDMSDSIISIKLYNIIQDNNSNVKKVKDLRYFVNNYDNIKGNCDISVNVDSCDVTIETYDSTKLSTFIEVMGDYGENIENLRMDIVIKDKFNMNKESLALNNYFSVFDRLSMYSITNSINNYNNVKYYSTIEDNKYKIRVIEPDCIEIEDKYESAPIKVTQNNKNVVGSVEIQEKMDVDKIGLKVINRYSGFYNPIFNDILYYDDYKYTKIDDTSVNLIDLELPYSNTNIDYTYNDGYGEFGIIKNVYYHKTNVERSDSILTIENPIYPIINEYALDYRDYNIFSSNWDYGYFITQDDLDSKSICNNIGSMKDGLCMFGSKYLNLPDTIFIDTFENGDIWDENLIDDLYTEIMYKEINNKTVKYCLLLEKRLKRHLKNILTDIFSKYINKNYSFGDKGTIEDDVEKYIEKNILNLYKVDNVYLYIKSDSMGINDRKIENEYLNFMDKNNEIKIKYGFPVTTIEDKDILINNKFIVEKPNEFDRYITYNLKSGFKETFGFGVLFTRK